MDLQKNISAKLQATYVPAYLEVVNESAMHSNSNGQSHFKIILVSEQFATQTRIGRQQAIHKLLANEYKLAHAISLQLFSPEEWAVKAQRVRPSPSCRGGSKS